MKHIAKHIWVVILTISLLVLTSCPEPHVHTWDNGIVTVPYCFQDGEITYTCTGCKETKTETVHALGHHAESAYHPNEWLIRDSVIQYTHCPVCGDEVLFGEEFTQYFTVDGNGVLSLNVDKELLPTHIMIPAIVNGTIVTTLKYQLLLNCTNLLEVEIPLTVTTIRGDAFRNCSGLSHFYFVSSITTVGEDAFTGSGITRVDFEERSDHAIPAFAVAGARSLETVVLPDGITEIGEDAFAWCTSLSNINIPDTLTTIGPGSFRHCYGLSDIELKQNVTTIGDNAFFCCTGFESFTIPDQVTSLGESAFSNCGNLSEINLPSGITTISDYLFFGCQNLNSVSIPTGVTSIGEYAFNYCLGLQSISMPASLESIGADAFYLASVSIVNYDGTSAEWNLISGLASAGFNNGCKIKCAGGVELTIGSP